MLCCDWSRQTLRRTGRFCESRQLAVISIDDDDCVIFPSVTDRHLARVKRNIKARENGQMMEQAHTVVPLVLEFTADGKVAVAVRITAARCWEFGRRAIRYKSSGSI